MFNLTPRRRNRDEVTEREDPFDALMSNFFSDFMDMAGGGFRTDVKEKEDRYIIEAELPGLNREDINVELDNDRLIISAINEQTTEEEKENYIRRERRTGSYQRSFRIENIKEEEIEAEYKNGILYLDLPKEEPGKSGKRVIDIK